MNINLTIPDANSADVLEGIAQATGWTLESGKTKAVWAREKCAGWIKDTAKRGLLRKQQLKITTDIDAILIT